MTRTKMAAGVIGAMALFSASAQAAPIISWDYNVTLEWTGAVFSAGNGSQISNGSELSWGATGGSHAVPGGDRSALVITDSPATGSIDTLLPGSPLPGNPGFPADPAQVGLTNTVTHYNNSISSSYATLNTAQVTSVLNLTPTNPAGPAIGPFQAVFDIYFTETPNTAGSCAVPGGAPCSDIFVISFGSLNQYLGQIDGYDYYASIFETSGNLNALSNDACTAAGASMGCLGFVTEENAETPAQFAFIITTVPILQVPEPGVLALLGIGLFGLGMGRRFARR